MKKNLFPQSTRRRLFPLLTGVSLTPLLLCVVLGGAIQARAQVQFTVNPAASWQGYMNVFELPANGGAYVFGSGWGVADLRASFLGPVLTLAPNTIGDPATFWYVGGGGPGAQGNKNMFASMYVETPVGSLAGQEVTFTGEVLANTLVSPYTSVAFIKDFAPDYSSFNVTTAPLVNGVFSISLNAINDPARHVQYGFETAGPNVWITDADPLGSVQITAVPEPSVVAFAVGGILCLAVSRRKTSNL